jgi:ATP-dependent RNA helicase DDX42
LHSHRELDFSGDSNNHLVGYLCTDTRELQCFATSGVHNTVVGLVFQSMGFFDDDDETDEEPKLTNQNTCSANVSDDVAEEEDPLDAYMKELHHSEATSIQEKQSFGTERLDLHEEDFDDYTTGDVERGNTFTPYGDAEDAAHAKKKEEAMFSMFRKGKSQDDYEGLCTTSQTPENHSIRKTIFVSRSTSTGQEWRRVHDTTLYPIHKYKSSASDCAVDPILQFVDVQSILGPNLYESVIKDYPTPTPVQSQTLPVTLSGKDALVTAATGQGKTLMYLLSVLSHVRQSESGSPSALVLCPTRELAFQVQSTVEPLASACRVTSRAIIGGQNKFSLWNELKRTKLDLVIATPGRLLDVVSDKKGFSLRSVGFVVLDEADKMLQMGFDKQVRSILKQVPINRQTLMLSATMGNKVGQLASDLLHRDAVRITVGRTGESSHHVQQHVVSDSFPVLIVVVSLIVSRLKICLPDETAKEAFMIEMAPVFLPLGRSIVFVSTKDKCEHLAKLLREQTNSAEILTLHGDLHQSDRTTAVRTFRKGDCRLLIATDVASRGLDIPNVQTIVSFDPAKTLDAHIHRVGRAGRLSKDSTEGQMTGSAYTLLTHANADFAFVLRNSFQREERPISVELETLAQSSRKVGMVDIRKDGNKQGLGFAEPNYYSGMQGSPPTKRSRWK